MDTTSTPERDRPAISGLVLGLAVLIALVSARDHAGCWNDGSRLATVEALVDHHTLAIDQSIFVQVPAEPAASPYPAGEAGLLEVGTLDKLRVNGHYYSDKSPVPALFLAALYQFLQWSAGLSAHGQPQLFCYLMTLASAGGAYVVAVWSIYRLGRPLGLPLPLRLALTASFALASAAFPYARHVNNHILLLGVAAALLLGLAWLAHETRSRTVSWPRLLGLGALAGFGYTIDLGAGPVLLACTSVLMVYRCRRLLPLFAFLVGAVPWLALHHTVNYAVGGTLGPANAVVAYFDWPGCPFTPENMTGGWKHPTLTHFVLYAADLLVGKRGFLGYNLPLFLALPALILPLWRRTADLPEILFAGCWCGGTWLAYAMNSNNQSGVCCSIRWFVPLLAPAYFALALLLRERPNWRWAFFVLSGWGAIINMLAWYEGPWMKHMVPGYWLLQGAALLSCVGLYLWLRRKPRSSEFDIPTAPARAA